MQRCKSVFRVLVLLGFLLNGRMLNAQEAAGDSAPAAAADSGQARPEDVTHQALVCAQRLAHSADFDTRLSVSGMVLHAFRPRLQSIDGYETDYVRVHVYARGSAKRFKWEVESHTITGRAPITTSVYSPRPPSREAYELRRRIQQECKPKESVSSAPAAETSAE